MVSELLPHTAAIADELCFVKSMHTEAINHDPAITFVQTGTQQAGRPSIGAWLSYGLGSENANLPAFVVLISRGRQGDQPLYSRLWGSGFLPSQHQGVQFRSGKDPVLYLGDPDGLSAETRRRMLDTFRALEEEQHARVLDPEIDARIAQYEMAYRMQTSVPEVTDFANEPQSVLDMYGPDVKTPGTFAANCLLARRLAERGVRFIQLYHRGWDQHGNLPEAHPDHDQDGRPAVGRAGHGPQAARAARRHAGHLGRRVRPHQLLAGQADEGQLRPRPPPARASPSGWPAAA